MSGNDYHICSYHRLAYFQQNKRMVAFFFSEYIELIWRKMLDENRKKIKKKNVKKRGALKKKKTFL